MVEITIQVPESLAARIAEARDRLPEVLEVGLRDLPPLPTEVYRYVLEFLASNPSPQAIADFQPTPTMQDRISELLERNRAGKLTPPESAELDEYEKINRFVRKYKIQAMKNLQDAS